MVDQTIGVLINPVLKKPKPNEPSIDVGITKNYACIAMPINHDNPELEDVLESIKEAADRCGIQAERIDDHETGQGLSDMNNRKTLTFLGKIIISHTTS